MADIATVAPIPTFMAANTAATARQAIGINQTQTWTTFTMSGAFTVAITATANTAVTLPISGTLASTASKLSDFAATTSAELRGVISDETGSGVLVFATSPTLVTPVLGVATATSVNKVTVTAPATSATLTIADGKTLGATASITLAGTDGTLTSPGAGTIVTLGATQTLTAKSISGATNTLTAIPLTTAVTGTLPVANGGTGITSLGTGVATFLGTPSSANLLAALTDETGTGAAVFATSPTLVTPVLGVATGTSIAVSGLLTSSSSSAGIGYAAGAGGTQSTSGTTPNFTATLNKISGQVTTAALTTAAGAEECVTVTNSTVAATDVVIVGTTYSGAGTPMLSVQSIGAGTFKVVITNTHVADAFDAAMTVNFAVIKAVNA